MNLPATRKTALHAHWRTHCLATRCLASALLLTLLSACTVLSAPQVVGQNIYTLDAQPAIQATKIRHDLVLAVSLLQARPGFDTAQMAYTQRSHELNYFATSRWTDTPAHMLDPLLLQTLQQTGGYRAVLPAHGMIPADIRLDTELIRLRHDFAAKPSRVQLTLRAQLIDVRAKRVLAVKEFDESENASSDDPYGGVSAANRVVRRVLEQLAEFCVTAPVLQ